MRREVDWHFAKGGHRVVEEVRVDVLRSCEYSEDIRCSELMAKFAAAIYFVILRQQPTSRVIFLEHGVMLIQRSRHKVAGLQGTSL